MRHLNQAECSLKIFKLKKLCTALVAATGKNNETMAQYFVRNYVRADGGMLDPFD